MAEFDGIKVVMGGGAFGSSPDITDAESISKALDILDGAGIKEIDAAQLYGNCEALLGEVGAAKRGFIVSTKDPGGMNGPIDAKKLADNAERSLSRLGTSNVDTFYIHAPDLEKPLEDYLPTVNELYEKGLFRRFGVSNYPPELVEKTFEYCKKNEFVLPSVYQGNYNILSRRQETALFPTLRKLGISFYAYSALAGGFLTKSKEQIAEGAGRFNDQNQFGPMYLAMFARPLLLEGLREWEEIAKEESCSKAMLAYRWVRYHSPLKAENGDAMIIGANSLGQMQDTLDGINAGPFSPKTVERLEHFCEKIGPDMAQDPFTDFIANQPPSV